MSNGEGGEETGLNILISSALSCSCLESGIMLNYMALYRKGSLDIRILDLGREVSFVQSHGSSFCLGWSKSERNGDLVERSLWFSLFSYVHLKSGLAGSTLLSPSGNLCG